VTEQVSIGQIREGTDVYGIDGHKVGSVVAIQGNYLVVEKGFFFPTDYYIPVSAINSLDGNNVYLNVSRDAALQSGWDVAPVDYGTGVVEEVVETDTTVIGDQYDNSSLTGTAGYGDSSLTDTAGFGTTTSTTVTDGDRIAIPIHEEELVARRQATEVGHVRVEKIVTSEEQSIDVPVTEERVRVERHIVDRPVNASDVDVFEDEVLEIPVHGEDVIAEKRVRVAEEVEISKEQVQRTEHVTGTVRREDVRVTDDVSGGVVGATGDDTGVIDSTR